MTLSPLSQSQSPSHIHIQIQIKIGPLSLAMEKAAVLIRLRSSGWLTAKGVEYAI